MKCDELKKYKAYEFGTSYVYHILEKKIIFFRVPIDNTLTILYI